jgi:outer membrane protein assembly factor BamB
VPRFSRCARIFAALASLLLTVGSVAAQQPQPNWADFRGPRGDGVAVGAQPPIHWSESDQVRWKAPVPGRGWSSPVLWGGW